MSSAIVRIPALSNLRRIRSQRGFLRICLITPRPAPPRLLSRSAFSSSGSSDATADGPPPPSACSHHPLLHFRSSRLGLDPLVEPQLEQIQQLPEIASALSVSEPDATTVSALERAVQIFGPMGGEPRRAVLSLLAETQCAVAGTRTQDDATTVSDYTPCLATIQEIQEPQQNNNPEGDPIVHLALAKVHWLNGDFVTAREICDSLVNVETVSNEVRLAARTGQAVARLCAVASIDDVFSVRDPFRMAFKRLENAAGSSTALAAACLNAGVAEAVWAETVQQHNEMTVPLDAAMRMWKKGLTVLERAKRVKNSNAAVSAAVRALLEARLYTNMAWGMLQMPHLSDHVSEASEYAGKALAVYDKNPAFAASSYNKEGMATTLSLVATCYHKSGGAVTAEGLFQSALDQPVHSPLQGLERRDCLTRYADLCREWEKREGEADKLRQKADNVEASLPVGWRGKSHIHSSLWFWTPKLFDY